MRWVRNGLVWSFLRRKNEKEYRWGIPHKWWKRVYRVSSTVQEFNDFMKHNSVLELIKFGYIKNN